MVCEVAGTLQVLLPGDLNYLFHASLDQEQINNLLHVVACENNITDFFRENSAAKSSSDPLKLRSVTFRKRKFIDGYSARLHPSERVHMRQRYDSSHIWKPLTKRQRRDLELSERLL